MRCERCNQGDGQPVKRAKLAERDGRVVVVLEVPMKVCPARGERWLDWDVARRLDGMFDAMLAADVEFATKHFNPATPPAA